jgi:putative peptidoglycan lipid II flippase
MGDGAITAFNVAFTVLQIPVGVIGVPLGIVVLPSLSREAAVGRTDEFVGLVSRALRLLLYVMLPITGLLAVLRTELVTILFGYGRFGAEAIESTSITLLAFLGGLAAHALIAVLARAFYARQDTRTPVAAAIVAVAVNTTLAVALAGSLGLPGLALAIAIGAWVEAALLTTLLTLRVPELPLGSIVRLGIKALLASVVASAVAFGLAGGLSMVMGPDASRLAIVGRMLIVGSVGLGTYLGLSAVLRITELGSIVGLMADLLRRPRRS